MSKPASNKDYELGSIRKPGQPYLEERPRTSSVAAIQYQKLKQIQQN
jgi:hypothetical protein